MIHSLKPFGVEPRFQIHFAVARRDHGLDFHFTLLGGLPKDLAEVVVPPVSSDDERKRTDELWKSTCLEIFFGPHHSREYVEINLAPSGNWNAYAFDGYREGMRPVEDVGSPLKNHDFSPNQDRWTWSARIEGQGGHLSKILGSPSLVLGATAVIEYRDGQREYWALNHAGEKPDFHLRESFVLAL